MRYPVEIGVVGDSKTSLAALIPLLKRKDNRAFLEEAQRRMQGWNALLAQIASSSRLPLRPQVVVKTLSDLLADDAVISLDCGANTHFAARHVHLRAKQQLTSPGMLATMAPGLPFAIAAQFAFPKRQSVAVVGDGGFAMLMAELSTAVQHNLPVKIVLLKNNSLSEVRFEQEDLKYPQFGCDLPPIRLRRRLRTRAAQKGTVVPSPRKCARQSNAHFARAKRPWLRLWLIPMKSRLNPRSLRPEV